MELADSLNQLVESGFSRTETGVAIGDGTNGCIIEEHLDLLEAVLLCEKKIVGQCELPKRCISWQYLASKLARGFFGTRDAFEIFRSKCTEGQLWEFFDFIQYGLDYEEGGQESIQEEDVWDEKRDGVCEHIDHATSNGNAETDKVLKALCDLIFMLDDICEGYKNINREMWGTISESLESRDIEWVKSIVESASELESIGATVEQLRNQWKDALEELKVNDKSAMLDTCRRLVKTRRKVNTEAYVSKLIREHELRQLAKEIALSEGEPISESTMFPECQMIRSLSDCLEIGKRECPCETVDGADEDSWIVELIERGRQSPQTPFALDEVDWESAVESCSIESRRELPMSTVAAIIGEDWHQKQADCLDSVDNLL